MNPNLILQYTKSLDHPLNHKASFDASTAVMCSASVVETVIVSCNAAF